MKGVLLCSLSSMGSLIFNCQWDLFIALQAQESLEMELRAGKEERITGKHPSAAESNPEIYSVYS